MTTTPPQPSPASDPRHDHLPCGVLRVDDAGRVLSLNTRLREWLRCEGGEAPRRLAELLAPASRLLFDSQLAARLKLQGRVDETQLMLRACDGSPLPVLANLVREDEAAPAPAVTTAVLMLASGRSQLQADLQRMQRSVEQIPGVLLQHLVSADGRSSVPYASEGLHELFGVTPAQVRHSTASIVERIHPDDAAKLMSPPASARGSVAPWHVEFRLMLPDGGVRWIEGRSRPQWLEDGAVLWHTYLCDATESRRLRDAVTAGRTALKVSRAKSDWLARVSHELRTPLNAVLGFTQVLAADPSFTPSDEHRQKFVQIELAGRNLLHLIDEVLELSRIETGRTQPVLAAVSLLPLLQEAAALLQLPARANGLHFSLGAAPGLAAVADARRLVQCLCNLLSNAVKYNQPGGRIEAGARREGDRVLIDVADTGRGLAAEQLAHLFEPFNRLGAEREPIEGSGLGLVITRGLVEAMGGSLSVRSSAGHGSCFTIALPAADLPAPDGGVEPVALGDAGADPPGRVLYVEDNAVNAMLMSAIFAFRPRLQLELADSASQATAKALARPPDLLLIDMSLPDADGMQLLGRLRQHGPLHGVPAVMVSADATPANRDRARQAGFSAYWTKPLDLHSTLQSLDRLLSPPPAA